MSDHATPTLFVVVALATIAVTLLISVFAAAAEWWLLAPTMLCLILGAILVTWTMVHTMDDGD